MAGHATLTVETLGHEVTEGHWCEVCLLPSVARLTVHVYAAGHLHAQTAAVCRDCGRKTP